jgi:hypothetical protein
MYSATKSDRDTDFADTIPSGGTPQRRRAKPFSPARWLLASRFGRAGRAWLVQLLDKGARSRGAVPVPVAALRRLLKDNPHCAQESPGLRAVLRALDSRRVDPLRQVAPEVLQRALVELSCLPTQPGERGIHLLRLQILRRVGEIHARRDSAEAVRWQRVDR